MLCNFEQILRHNDTVGFSSKEIGLIMDTVACLHLVASKILIQVVDEIDLFGAFTSWMRYEIDRLAADSSVPKEDELEKEASLDHSKVLMYLQTCMTTSPIEIYLGDSTLDESKSTWSHSQKGVSMFELLDKQLQKQEQGLAYLKSLPRVELLCKHLTEQAKDVFSQIARAEKRNVIFGKPQEIGSIEKDGLIDMYMASEVRFLAF
jgi:anaphase-promoting complex subunit 4